MNVYGPLVIGNEAFAAARAQEEATSGSVYGHLVTGHVEVAPAAPVEPPAPAADMTVAELTAALAAAPTLAKSYLDAELARPAGVRKGALTVIRDTALAAGDADTAKLADDTLAAVA